MLLGGKGKWVAVGENGIIANSTDGRQWNVIKDSMATTLGQYRWDGEPKNPMYNQIINFNYYVATGMSNGSIFLTSDNYDQTTMGNVVVTSKNGINWEIRIFDVNNTNDFLILNAINYGLVINRKTVKILKSNLKKQHGMKKGTLELLIILEKE